MEFGLTESLPIYSGGLGVLAGDFMRAAHALSLPVVGIGIAWGDGYTTQHIDHHGDAHDLPTPFDRKHLHREAPVVHVNVAGHDVPLAIWRVDGLDAAPLYLLEPTEERDHWITRRLYGGSKDDRVAQEIVLGVGGVRALQALDHAVDVYHFNEGHALFAGLELIRQERAHGADFDAAWAATRRKVVFTTHTPIDAGNEEHDLERLRKMGIQTSLGLSTAELERLGGRPFNMTVGGLRLARAANAVAELHGETARRMWRHVSDAAPIVAITNGTDHRVWQDARVRAAMTSDAGEGALLSAHAACKRELIDALAARTGVHLDEHKLLIGFARRATAYKRATLLFHDEQRIARLLGDGQLQVVYAGKAHPHDAGGQELVRQLVKLARRFPSQVVFAPNYDLSLGRLLTRGCDVWLNTPRRPLEACGTSGMKAAMNGVLNLSIPDGWWPEACEHGANGWQIGDGSSDGNDAHDAAQLYDLLEREVLPIYYAQPARWRAMMRASITTASWRFSADRMVQDYFANLYPIRETAADVPLRRVASGS
jgi:starch phosphorylase